MNAADLMTPDPATLTPRHTVRDAIDLMRDLDVRHVPVVDGEGVLVGMVSDRDLRPMESEPDSGQLDVVLQSVMWTDVISVTIGDDVTEVVDLMIDHKVGAVPVVDNAEQRLLGIVSYIDVLREARDVLE